MQREPANRYAGASELAAEIEKWLADEPVAAYREPFTVRLRRWTRRHRTLVATAAVVLVMALGLQQVRLSLLASRNLAVSEEAKRTAAQRDLALRTLRGLASGLRATPNDRDATTAVRLNLLRQADESLAQIDPKAMMIKRS